MAQMIVPNSRKQIAFYEDLLKYGGATLRESLGACFQCGTCTASCPTRFAMDHPPRRLLRMVQLGMKDEVLSSSTIWLCVSCKSCIARCPRGADMSEIMAALKNMAIKEGAKAEVKGAPTFYKTFVNVVKKYGRLSESMLMMQYFIKRLAIKETLQYAPLGLMFYKKGKLPIKPEKIAQRDHIKSMVKNISLIEKGK